MTESFIDGDASAHAWDAGMTFATLAFAHDGLKLLVRAPWTLSYGSGFNALPGIIAPDAHVEFVFQTGSPCSIVSGGEERCAPPAMLFAQRHGTLRLKPNGANRIVAFRTPPAVASAILGQPLAACWDQPLALTDLIGTDADRLLDALHGAPAEAQAVILESWLLSRLGNWGPDSLENLRLQRTLLWRSAGESIARFSDRLGITQRTLRRQFQRHAGLSPKQLAMSGRILRACAALGDRRSAPLAAIALDLGFADQAAFGNAFRHYVGMTPTALRAEPLIFCERIA